MIDHILADIVLVLHFAFILFVVFGGLLALRRPRLIWLHVPVALWGMLIEFIGWTCPLTPLEKSLRRSGGEAGYEGGFVEHYIAPLIYPGELSRGMQVLLGVAVLLINGLIYGYYWFSRERKKT